MSELNSNSSRFQALLIDALVQLLEPAVEALRAHAVELDEREECLRAREQEVEAFIRELKSLEGDLVQGDTRARYSMPDFEEEGGIHWVKPDSLPTRELQLLTALQLDAEGLSADASPRLAPRLVVMGSNNDLAARYKTQLGSANTSSVSACLTRMRHRGLIETSEFGGLRHIHLLARLRDP